MSVYARFVLRAALSGAFASNGVLLSALPGITGGDALLALFTGIGSALAYAGIGAAVPQVEPHVGNKLQGE